MKRYTKKPKTPSRKTLERDLRKAERTINVQSAVIKDGTSKIWGLQDRARGAEDRVQELQSRLDGLFQRGESFRVNGYTQDVPRPLRHASGPPVPRSQRPRFPHAA